LEALRRTHFHHIITGDEGWFYLEYPHTPQWSVSRDEVPQRVDAAIGTAKFMLTTIWGERLPPARFDAVTVQI
jgi:hypothetical protein